MITFNPGLVSAKSLGQNVQAKNFFNPNAFQSLLKLNTFDLSLVPSLLVICKIMLLGNVLAK